MKYFKINFLFLSLLALSAISAQAAQLASAKVLSVQGTATKTSLEKKTTNLSEGDILTEGMKVETGSLGVVELVFSNGSMITLQPLSGIEIEELTQENFGGNKAYEQLQADPSASQTVLALDYGKLDGHVKKLNNRSKFNIKTAMGTAAIRGTIFTVEINVDSNNNIVLTVTNVQGAVEVENSADPGSDGPVVPGNTVIIRISPNDPNYDDIIDVINATFKNSQNVPPVIIQLPGPVITPEEPGDIIVSPAGPAN